ncbi:aminotransferase class V-fold PLP-dependent enzyme [Streptomyces pactum]|uniref:aminotransferase class V-fold PLP-dependent enzyme n=1 Tax=Streptomyces pactum TaxID=68249 RepID=UPI003FD7FD49
MRQEAAAEAARLRELVDRIRLRVPQLVPDVEVVGDPVHRLPHLVTFSCLYVDGEALLHELDRRGFSVSSGSSCTSSTLIPSHVLRAMGVLSEGNVRVSLPPGCPEEDVERFLALLPEVVAAVRERLGAPAGDAPGAGPVRGTASNGSAAPAGTGADGAGTDGNGSDGSDAAGDRSRMGRRRAARPAGLRTARRRVVKGRARTARRRRAPMARPAGRRRGRGAAAGGTPEETQGGAPGTADGGTPGGGTRPGLVVDSLGKRCPIPVIELAKVIGDVPVGGVVTVLSDDEAARLDIPAWCAMRGQQYLGERPAVRGTAYRIVRRA